MTGLDVFNDRIIEICCIVTDGDLNIVDEGYENVIHCDKEIMDAMNPWCVNQHGKVSLFLPIYI
jgi:oligoribonuclease